MSFYKICNAQRNVRKDVMAKSLEDLKKKGCDKLGLTGTVTVVTEETGRAIHDDQTLAEYARSNLIILEKGERWKASGNTDDPLQSSELTRSLKENYDKKGAATKYGASLTKNTAKDQEDGAPHVSSQGGATKTNRTSPTKIKPDTASESNFTDLAEELTPSQLQRLYIQLGIDDRDVKKAESSAASADENLKAKCVLLMWRQNKADLATREALLDGLQQLKFMKAHSTLLWKWFQKQSSVGSTPEVDASDRDLMEMIEPLTPDALSKFYIRLGISEATVQKEVKKSETQDVTLQAIHILRKWLQEQGPTATRKSLLKELAEFKLTLSKKLEERGSSGKAHSSHQGPSPIGKEGMEQVSDADIRDITNELGKDQLTHLYVELKLKQNEIENAEDSANTRDNKLKAASVLRYWRQINGQHATRQQIIIALEGCRLTKAKEALQAAWQLKDHESVPPLTGPSHTDSALPGPAPGPISQRSPVIDSIRKQLKEHYQSKLCKKQVYPWKADEHVDLSTIYVPVNMDMKLPGARKVKEHLESYHSIFSEEQVCRRLVLDGNPGQGKSMFTAKIAFDWCQDDESSPLKHIELLFVIELGLVDHKTNIEDAIISQLLPDSPDIDAKTLLKAIRDLGKSVVVILDGLDEAPPDFFEHQDVGNIIRTIKFKTLKNCRVLVATRPWRTCDITKLGHYRHLELRKMNKSDVKKLIEKVFNVNKDDLMTIALGNRLLEYVEANKLLVDTSTPLIVLLISWYWAETDGKEAIPDRVGELYDQIITLMYECVEQPMVDKVNYHFTGSFNHADCHFLFPLTTLKGEQILVYLIPKEAACFYRI